jgi:hypothetical protein
MAATTSRFKVPGARREGGGKKVRRAGFERAAAGFAAAGFAGGDAGLTFRGSWCGGHVLSWRNWLVSAPLLDRNHIGGSEPAIAVTAPSRQAVTFFLREEELPPKSMILFTELGYYHVYILPYILLQRR